MKLRYILYSGIVSILVTIILERLHATAPANPPASVTKTANETEFNTITLKPKAEERLKIKSVEVVRKNLTDERIYGGEVILPISGAGDSAGSNSQSILSLLPTMTAADRIKVAEAQVEADGLIHAARAQLEAVSVNLARATRMLEEKSGSRRAMDDAQAQVSLAEAELSKALSKRELLGPPVLASVTPETVWVRVPVYVGDLDRIDKSKTAKLVALSARAGEAGRIAVPVSAPPSSNPAAASIDLFYAADNKDQRFQLGQRVGVALALNSGGDALVVPWSSVISDIYGGTWVYESKGDHQFVRQRVQVDRVVGEVAALASGPPIGAKVVTDGAAELFGTEVGFSK
jgi:hypothetical protein